MNSQFVVSRAADFARRVRDSADSDTASQIETAWQLAFARDPLADEMTFAEKFLSEQLAYLKQAEQVSPGADDEAKEAKATESNDIEPELQCLTNLCQVLLGSNEFIYVD